MADKENSPPRKRARYLCKFSDKIAQEYPDITRSKLGDVHAFCWTDRNDETEYGHVKIDLLLLCPSVYCRELRVLALH